MTKDKAIPIAEIFGPTLQGEGALAGVPTYFVRVGGCDYDCNWCDSAHAVLAERVRRLPRLTQEQIFEQLMALPEGPRWLTISGGNPALYDLTELTKFWQAKLGMVAVETQGSKWQEWLSRVDLLTVSPKPPSAGKPMADVALELEAFVTAMAKAPLVREVFKVVVFDEADYNFAVWVHQAYPWFKMYLSVGTAMGGLSGYWAPPAYPDPDFDKFEQPREHPEPPGGHWTTNAVTDDTQSHQRRWRWLADKMKGDKVMADVVLLPQLHALIWGFRQQGV